jgi:hypothetical protein
MLYVLKKEQIEHARLRALAQAIIAKEKGKEVFEEYMKVAFPWLENQKRRDKDDHMRLLMEEVKRGGMHIKPLQEVRAKSRMRTKIVSTEGSKQRPRAERDRLYSKLGKAIPI